MLLENYSGQALEDFEKPTLLFDNGLHSVYWLGFPEETAFRTNSYLIRDMEQLIVVDPGAYDHFDFILNRINQIDAAENIDAIVLCHQDPDVAASLPRWLDMLPNVEVITTHRTEVLLGYYTQKAMNLNIVDDNIHYTFKSGNRLRFVEAPFMHFPGAFATYDPVASFLFSGDVFAALDYDWTLVIDDFKKHRPKLDLFHKDYMASNKATAGFAAKIESLPLNAILPQHGSIIPDEFVAEAVDYLRNLKCGLDLIYP
ncbi:MAG: MBL fold metallo-hydrolase [Bacteroidota bacterium]